MSYPGPLSIDHANGERLTRFVIRLEEHGAEVLRATSDTLSQTIIGLIGRRGWHRVVSVRRNRVGHPSVLGDDPPLSDEDLAGLDAVITESVLGVAETGTVILDHASGQGRPALTALSPVHVCVVEGGAIVDDVATARASLGSSQDATWVAGPDAPTDLIEKVQRPRSLIVVLVGDR